MISLLDRYKGCLLGVHAGDALGAPYESWEPSAIAEDFAIRGGLVPFAYDNPWNHPPVCPPGRPTDDSELTAALAESLLACDGINLEDQYRRFKKALGGTSFLWEGRAFGFGKTTQRMLRRESYAESQRVLQYNPELYRIASNGSLMRSAPLALFYQKMPRHLPNATRRSSTVTHVHPEAIECCVVFGYALLGILDNFDGQTLWQTLRLIPTSEPRIEELLEASSLEIPPATNVWMKNQGPAGSALHTLKIALWCFFNSDSFREGIQKAVSFGGDTDTAAAVTGALLGAKYGIEGIPSEWLDVLKGRDRMQELAERLYNSAH